MKGIRPLLLVVILMAALLSFQPLHSGAQAGQLQVITMPFVTSGPFFVIEPRMESNFYMLAFNDSLLTTLDKERFVMSPGPFNGTNDISREGLDIAQMTDTSVVYDREYFYSDAFGDTGF